MSTDASESTDDLSKPLGQKKKKKQRFVVPMWIVSRSIAGVLGLCVAVLAGWILFVDEPYGGEPMAMVSAYTRASPPAKAGEPLASTKKSDAAASALAEGEKPGQTVTIIDGSTGKRQEVSVGPAGTKGGQKAGTNGPAKPDASIDPRFLESSRHGQIPKIAPDGARCCILDPSVTFSRWG